MDVVNEEIKLYQEVSKKIKLRKIWTLLNLTPHDGQIPVITSFDDDVSKNCYVTTLGRRSGKSFSTGVIVIRELLIPFSNTILLCPTYRNSKILFDEVYKQVLILKLTIRSINKNQFVIELENGAKFGSFTESNVEAALGSRVSLLIVDETQSVAGIIEILENLLMPMLLDYGLDEYGILYAKMVFLGTPRGIGTAFHELFLKEKSQDNWASFSAPSTCNPLLPRKYLEDQKYVLSERAYLQEIEAKWLTTGAGVFHAFDEELNLYDPNELDFKGSSFITGHDFGTLDSTSMVGIYVTNTGDYYVNNSYMANMRTTMQHVTQFKKIKESYTGEQEGSYGDPSAAQSMLDLRNTYDYDITKGYNRIAPGIAIMNELLAPQGLNRKPKLFISKYLGELIAQMQLITYRNEVGAQATTGDPFNKHKEHHFDLVHALRYAIVTHYRQNQAALVVLA